MKPRTIVALVAILGICCAISAGIVTIVRYNQWVAQPAKTRLRDPGPNYQALATTKSAPGTKITKNGCLASSSEELLVKAISSASENNSEAFRKLTASGLVFPLKGGLQVELVDTDASNGLVKIRPRGETLELWTYMEALE